MKIAAETVIWGNNIEDLARVFDTVMIHGCTGVEISQRPETLGDVRDLENMLKDRGLTLTGLAGGTVHERIEFCGDVLRPEYLYVEDWDAGEAKEAKEEGFVLALHPHLFKPVHRLEEADRVLKEHEELLFLPDCAHLTILGDSPVTAIERWKDRLAAVHMKDWSPFYGRSSHRYARGFVELGRGIVKWDPIFRKLEDIKYRGWVVFEQGSPTAMPEHVVEVATTFLGNQKRTILNKRTPPQSIPPARPEKPQEIVSSPKAEARYSALKDLPALKSGTDVAPVRRAPTWEDHVFLEAAFHVASVDEPRSCYAKLAEAVGQLLKSELTLLCSSSPSANLMEVVGVYPANQKLTTYFMKYRGSLSHVAVERQTTTTFDLTSPEPGNPYGRPEARFGYPQLIRKLGVQELISIPVLHPQNPHQARLVLNIFPKGKTKRDARSFEHFAQIGRFVAQAADSALDERCALAVARANVAAGNCQQSEAFLEALRELILSVLDCRATTIFLVNDAGNRLEAARNSKIRWAATVPREEQFYRMGEGLVGKVWQRRESRLSADPLQEAEAVKKSDEALPGERPSFLCAPMLTVAGDVVGVVRCQNKKGDAGTSHMFSEDDLAVLDGVCQAAVPHLQVLLSKERRGQALRRLTHELHNPLIGLNGATELMKMELEERSGTSNVFKQNYIDDILSWKELMQGLLGNADLFRIKAREIKLQQKATFLYADVFVPVIHQLKQLLFDRDFSAEKIKIEPFDAIPKLWIDKYLFNQVAFNLLTNAIKYADEDPAKFRVRVFARQTDTHFEINFCDWGPGISADFAEAIFLEGVRSKHAEQRNVTGDGIGLSIAREIIKAHWGTIKLSSFQKPTCFTISLPKFLEHAKEPRPTTQVS